MSEDYYLKAITELSNQRKIIASCDINSQNGTKLVAKGIRITSKMYDQLINHKLLPSLDHALTIDNALTVKDVIQEIEQIISADERLKKAVEVVNRSFPLQKIISHIPFPNQLSFKLTIFKEKLLENYRHSLLLTIISIYLADCDGMDADQKILIASASLFQDIGLLHIDPKLLEPSYRMSEVDRRHLYAHPLSAYILLNEIRQIPKEVSNAVLEHHEKMDGSGYPRGMRRPQISRYGQILGVSVVVAKAFELNSNKPRITWGKIEVILRLNSNQYGEGLIGYLNLFRAQQSDAFSEDLSKDQLIEHVNITSKLFNDFNRVDYQAENPVYLFTNARLSELQLGLFRAGIDPRNPQSLIQMLIDEPSFILEIKPIIEECVWQFKSLILEISRKWPEESLAEIQNKHMPNQHWFSDMRCIINTY